MRAARQFVRRGVRILAFACWTLALFLGWALCAPGALVSGRLPRWRARVQQLWSRGVCRILGVHVDVLGQPPQRACLLAANHLSYLDVVVLGALVPCAFVAKSEIARWPVLGFLARSFGTLFVERENRRALPGLGQRLRTRLARGETLVLFPEGTSTAGSEVLPFRPALLAPAVALGLPVAYAALHYSTPAAERPAAEVVCWWGDMTFGAHVLGLLRLERIQARVHFGSEALAGPDRKALAVRLRSAVVERLQPLAQRHV